jgi:predicted dienelactone hydrolase
MQLRSRGLVAVVVVALGSACAGDPDDEPPPPPSAEQLLVPGPHAVGFRDLVVDYTAPAPVGARTLPLRLWYPAIAAGEPAAEYAVAGIVSVPSGRALAAPALAGGAPFPLAIYSHGSGGEGLIGYPYGEHLASHGWVVIAPNHVGNTALDGLMMTFDPFGHIALERPLDISAILDWLEAGAGGDPIAAAVTTARVLLFGHSFGAYTTFAGGGVDLDVARLAANCNGSCEELDDAALQDAIAAGFGDPRVAAIAPQAPALVPSYRDGELAALAVPTLLMSGRRDLTTTDAVQARPAWGGLDHPGDLWVEAPDGGHLSFITVCDDLDPALLEVFQPNYLEDGCGPSFTPVAELVPTFAAYLLGFGRRHVAGEAAWDAVLRGPALHPSVFVTSR